MKTYTVPVIYTYVFGADVEVEAASPEEALKLALEGKGDSGGLDWDRSDCTRISRGDWAEVTEID